MTEIKESLCKRFFKGFWGTFRGIGFIHKNSLWKFVILPIIITMGLAFAANLGVSFLINSILKAKLTALITQYADYNVLKWIAGILIKILSVVMAFVIVLFLYSAIGSIVWSIFSGPLQSRLEKIVTGKTTEVPFGRTLKWTLISIMDSIIDILLLLLVTLLSFLFLIILLIGVVFQLITVTLFASYLIGRTTFRLTGELYCKTRKERNSLAKQFKAESTGIAILEVICTSIPFFNFVIVFFLWAGSLAGSMLIYYNAKGKS